MAIRNMAELQKMLEKQARDICEMAANEVYEAINYYLSQYYSEWEPKLYLRTESMLHSAFKTKVVQVGNSFKAEVGIDYEALDDYIDATGWEVVNWANTEEHGGMNVNTHTRVFSDAVDNTINNGQLLADCIEFLRKRGFIVIS